MQLFLKYAESATCLFFYMQSSLRVLTWNSDQKTLS